MSERPRPSGAPRSPPGVLTRPGGRSEDRKARPIGAGAPGSTSASLQRRPGWAGQAPGALARGGAALWRLVHSYPGRPLCLHTGWPAWRLGVRGGKRPGGPGRAPPGSRRDRVPNVDTALERRKEPRFSRSVPKPFQPLSFLCTQLPQPPFSSLTIPRSSPSPRPFPSPRLFASLSLAWDLVSSWPLALSFSLRFPFSLCFPSFL